VCRDAIELFRDVPLALFNLKTQLELLEWSTGEHASVDVIVRGRVCVVFASIGVKCLACASVLCFCRTQDHNTAAISAVAAKLQGVVVSMKAITDSWVEVGRFRGT
jgi:hypothetical protein